MTTTLYTTTALVTGDGRNGHGRITDGQLEVDLATPKDMGGSGAGTNPEQLFATGYAACFHEALRLTGRQDGIDVTGSSVEATVSLDRHEDDSYNLTVTLKSALPQLDRLAAEQLTTKAHTICPYSRAIRNNVDVHLIAVAAPDGASATRLAENHAEG